MTPGNIQSLPHRGAGLILLWLVILGVGFDLDAHDTGSSYLRVSLSETHLALRWEIALHDFDDVLNLDKNRDGAVSADELRANYPSIQAYALGRLRIGADGDPLKLEVSSPEPLIEKLTAGTNLILNLEAHGTSPSKLVEVEYRLFFEVKPQHRGLLLLECDGNSHTAMFSPDRPLQRFDLGARRPVREFLNFGWEGVWHIWIGLDHVLFLIALLLPAVLKREADSWGPVPNFREAFFNVLKIVTAFTVAHSITLSLATLEVVRLPSRWVESAIAASVLIAAINNVRPHFHGRVWLVAFGFGLIHGFGFANALTELGLSRSVLVIALVSVNLGVELGQLAIVCVFLPAAYSLRHSRAYQGPVLQLGSAGIALLAGLWMIERIFDLKWTAF